jgi:hypothetical protein
MRSLGIALCIAWMSVGLELQWLPPSRLQSEMSFSKDFIESIKESPLADQPAMQQAVAQSKRLVGDQSTRGTSIWLAWSALLLMVGYGLWTAYAVFRQLSYALGFVLVGCLLFLIRETIFNRAAYALLVNGSEKFQQILNAGHYQLAFAIIWHNYVVGSFFLLVTIFTSIQMLRNEANSIGQHNADTE